MPDFASRAAIVLVLMLVTASGAGARLVGDDPARGAVEADERGRHLLDVAIGVEGAMGADLALRLLETGQLHTTGLRREARELVRLRLSVATEPFQPLVVSHRGADSRQQESSVALGIYPVDALSLRCRLAMQFFDPEPQTARGLVLDVAPGLELPPPECRDVLLPQVDVFYRTLSAILAGTLTARERRELLQWEIARRYVGGIGHPMQIAPAAAFIEALGAPRDVTDRLASELGAAVGRIPGSPRALFHVVAEQSWNPVGELLERLPEASRRQLCGELKGFVLRSLQAPRCADLPSDAYPAEALSYLNDTVFVSGPVVSDEAARRPVIGDAPAFTPIWSSARSRAYGRECQDINWDRRTMVKRGETEWTDWKLRYLKFASSLRDWSAISERDDYDYLVEKSSIIAVMLENAPDEASLLEVVEDFVSLVRHSNRSKVPSQVLLAHASVSLSRLPEARRKLVFEMLRSGPAPVSAYAEFQLEGVDAFRIVPPGGSPGGNK